MLRAFVESNMLTQKAVAKHIGVSLGTVRAWLDGKARPRAEQRLLLHVMTEGEVGEMSWLTDEELYQIHNATQIKKTTRAGNWANQEREIGARNAKTNS